MSCEHDWRVEGITSLVDDGYPNLWMKLALVCSNCQATATVDGSTEVWWWEWYFNDDNVRVIEGDEEE
jgi:hypothetical protein